MFPLSSRYCIGIIVTFLCVLDCLSLGVYPTLPYLYITFPVVFNCLRFLRVSLIGSSYISVFPRVLVSICTRNAQRRLNFLTQLLSNFIYLYASLCLRSIKRSSSQGTVGVFVLQLLYTKKKSLSSTFFRKSQGTFICFCF